MKRKIVICGGGVAGLSAATLLSENSSNEVHLYEVNDRLGGQSGTIKSDMAYTENSWRIFGDTYHNLNHIINKIQIDDNFHVCKKTDGTIVIGDNVFEGSSTLFSIFKIFSRVLSFNSDTMNKLLNVLFLCKDRAINAYHNTNALEYFNDNRLVALMIGGYIGHHPEEASLSTFFAAVRRAVLKKKYFFTPKNLRFTKNLTNESLFDPWGNFLEKRGVKIYKNSELKSIQIENNNVINLLINDEFIQGDEFIMSLSLEPLLKILKTNSFFNDKETTNKLSKLVKDLARFVSMNFYFNQPVPNSDTSKVFALIEETTPFALKRQFEKKYLDNCYRGIQEIWNVALVTDLAKVSQYTLEEIANKTINDIKNSPYVISLLNDINKTWDEVFIGYEFDRRHIDAFNKKETKDYTVKKLSININTDENLIANHPEDVPSNMYFAAFYVKSTRGGVSMEASCETGLMAAKLIHDKHGIQSDPSYIHNYNGEVFNFFTHPFALLDKILYRLNFRPITDFIPSSFLLVAYVVLVSVILIYSFHQLYESFL